MKVIYPIPGGGSQPYIEFMRYTSAMFAAERFHPERKADENALAVNNVSRVSKARTRLQGDKINLTSFHPRTHFQLLASCCPSSARIGGVGKPHDFPNEKDAGNSQEKSDSGLSSSFHDDYDAIADIAETLLETTSFSV